MTYEQLARDEGLTAAPAPSPTSPRDNGTGGVTADELAALTTSTNGPVSRVSDHAEVDRTRGGLRVRRNVTLAIGVAAVVVASAVGWVAGRRIHSPAEIAARTAPPKPSLIAVPVEKRQLSSDVVVRGTVRYGLPQVVSLPTSGLKPAKGIVTTAPVKGSGAKEGDVALALSGRPVFVLQGALPAYRDLGPGSTGDDVRQLEEALVRLGFDPGPVDGVYDGGTQFAVAAWYQKSGFTPFGPTDDQLAAMRAAQGEQFGVQSDLLTARSELASARGALTTAQGQAQVAKVAAQGAPAAEAAAQAKSEQDRRAAEAEVATRTSAVAAALDAQQVAQLKLDEGRAADPPLSPAELADLEAALRQATSSVDVARADLVAAQAALTAVETPVPGAITAELNRAVAAANADVAQANEDVRLAERKVALLSSRDKTTGGTVNELTSKLGVQVPADEVLFFPALPLRIDDATVKVGDEVTGPVMTVSNFQLAVDAALSAQDAKLVRVGAPVAIDQPDLGIHTTGTVTQIADTPGTNGVDPQRFYLEVTPTDAPATLVGTSVVLTVTVDATEGEVLAVPIAALSVAADGTSRVQVQAADGSTKYVTVTPGLSAKGMVAITPAGPLAAGDLVVVGTQAGSPPLGSLSPTTLSPPATTTGSTNAP